MQIAKNSVTLVGVSFASIFMKYEKRYCEILLKEITDYVLYKVLLNKQFC